MRTYRVNDLIVRVNRMFSRHSFTSCALVLTQILICHTLFTSDAIAFTSNMTDQVTTLSAETITDSSAIVRLSTRDPNGTTPTTCSTCHGTRSWRYNFQFGIGNVNSSTPGLNGFSPTTNLTQSLLNLSCGTTYTFRGRVEIDGNGGSPSGALNLVNFQGSDLTFTTSACPPAPSAPSASDGLFLDKIQITWGSVNDATSYEVYRCTDPDLDEGGDEHYE